MPDSGPNQHKLELREVAPSAALTVKLSPALPAVVVPGG